MSVVEPSVSPENVAIASPVLIVWRRARGTLALTAVLAVALAVRVIHADFDPSYDELWHMALSVGRGTPWGLFAADRVYLDPQSQVSTTGAPPWWTVWTHMNGVLHPPLYCMSLRWWRDAFGDSIAVARAYTYAWSLVSVGFTFAIARMRMGLVVAIGVGLAMAVAPTQVYLGQEIRSYAMMLGLASFTLWWMTRIETFGPSRRAAVVLGSMPLLLTHYFAFGAVVAIGMFGAWRMPGHRRAFLAAYGASAVLYLVGWVPFAVRQIGDIWTGDGFARVDHRDLVAEFLLVATAPFRLLADRKAAVEPLGVLAVVLFVWPWFLTRRFGSLRPWALWLAGSILTVGVLDVVRSTVHVAFARYVSVATPAVLPLVAGCVYAAARPRAAAAVAFAVALGAGAYLWTGTWITFEIPPTYEPTHLLTYYARPGDGLIVYRGDQVEFFGQVMLMQASVEPGFFPRPIVEITRPMTPAMVAHLPRQTWLLAQPLDRPVEMLIPGVRVVWSKFAGLNTTLSLLELDHETPTTAPARIR